MRKTAYCIKACSLGRNCSVAVQEGPGNRLISSSRINTSRAKPKHSRLLLLVSVLKKGLSSNILLKHRIMRKHLF